MNKLLAIKEKQIKDAKKKGLDNPYDLAMGAKPGSNKPLNKLQTIKQQQIDTAEENGAENPYVVGFDPGTSNESVTVVIQGNLELFQAAMEVDLARIKTAKNLEEKARIKAELLPNYMPFVDEYVADGDNYPCDIAVRVMIWQFDTGDIENALALGLHLVAIGNQVMPAKFDRDLPTFIADAMYDWSNVQLKAEQTASPYLDELVSTVVVDKWDLHPAVTSKNIVMLAKHRFREGEYLQCATLCEGAEKVNPEGAGVKTLKKNALAKLQSAK